MKSLVVTAARISVALLVAACVTDQADTRETKPLANYVPSVQPHKNLDVLRAEVENILGDNTKYLIRKNFTGHSRIAYFPESTRLSVSDDGVSMKFTGVGLYDYDKPTQPSVYRYEFSYDELADVNFSPSTCTTTTAPLPHGMELNYNRVVGPEICDTLFNMGQRYRQQRDKDAAAFLEQAAKYRNALAKPALSEDQRRLIVQAESLRQRKDYAGAASLFRQLVRTSPTAYPVAYFNLALLYEQQENYRQAIAPMRKYLLLSPDAKDARAAQDKIYEWEMLAGSK
jgi:tetratricopeptide (TPR) repeat protein